MDHQETTNRFTAIYDLYSSDFHLGIVTLLQSPPDFLHDQTSGDRSRGTEGSARLTRSDLTTVGRGDVQMNDGYMQPCELVRCTRGTKGVIYRFSSRIGQMPFGARRCGVEYRTWQRMNKRSPHFVRCYYAAYEQVPDDCHWFLHELPKFKMSEYLLHLRQHVSVLTPHEVLTILDQVVEAVISLHKLNFIVSPRALAVGNLWLGSDGMVKLENGILLMDGQWANLTPRDLVMGHTADQLNSFTYLQVPSPEEALLWHWRQLAVYAARACLRQLVVLTHDLLLRTDSGFDSDRVTDTPTMPHFLATRIAVVEEYLVAAGEIKLPLVFANLCIKLADEQLTAPEYSVNLLKSHLATAVQTTWAKCCYPLNYCNSGVVVRPLQNLPYLLDEA